MLLMTVCFYTLNTFFYLKLRADLLMPATTIQTIIAEFQNVNDIGLTHLLKKLSDKLTVLSIREATISNIIDEVKKEDLLKTFNNELSTDQRRKTAFKNNLDYIQHDDDRKERFAQYIPGDKQLI